MLNRVAGRTLTRRPDQSGRAHKYRDKELARHENKEMGSLEVRALGAGRDPAPAGAGAWLPALAAGAGRESPDAALERRPPRLALRAARRSSPAADCFCACGHKRCLSVLQPP